MPILTFELENGAVNDADQVMELLQELEAVLDGGVEPENLAADFTLDATTQLTNADCEVHIPLKMFLGTTITTGIKDVHELISGAYEITGAYLNYSMAGAGTPSGSPATVSLQVLAGTYTAGAFVTTSTIVSSTTFYSTTGTTVDAKTQALTLNSANVTGPKAIALKIDAIPATNPPTSGFVAVTLVCTRNLQ